MDIDTIPASEADARAFIDRDGGMIPGSRYARSDGSDLADWVLLVACIMDDATGEQSTYRALDDIASMVVNGADDIGLTILRDGPSVGIDPTDWLDDIELDAARAYERFAYGEDAS